MRRRAAVLLAVGALACSGHRLVLSSDWPVGVPAAREMAGWEKIEGETETSRGWAVYAMYVDPQRAGIYTVTRYRVRWREVGRDGQPSQRTETEKYLWLRRRELGVAVCFERRDDGSWQELAADGEAYRAEMLTAMGVFQLHRAVRTGRQD